MHRMTPIFFAVLAVSAVPARPSGADTPTSPGQPAQGDLEAGKVVFVNNCVICHGAGGRGDGPGSATLNPKPADLTDRALMAKVDEPTRVKALNEGVPALDASRSSPPRMPSFREVLSEKQIRDVLAYVRSAFTH